MPAGGVVPQFGGRVRRAGAGQHGPEGHGILERLARALSEVGRHRVPGVAQQRHPPDGERGQRPHQLLDRVLRAQPGICATAVQVGTSSPAG
jgi:hypothetical protein